MSSHDARIPEMLEAIKLARTELAAGRPSGATSLLRLARHIGATLGAHRPEVARACAAVEGAPPEVLGEAADQLVGALRAASSGVAVHGGGVLLVEDDKLQADVLRLALEARLGSVVTWVRTAAEARASVSRARPAVVVFDLMLPDEDGRELLAEWAEDERLRGLPIMVLSGASAATIRAECLALGAREVYAKPVTPDAITAAVASFRPGGDAGAAPDSLRELLEAARKGGPWAFVVLRTLDREPSDLDAAQRVAKRVLSGATVVRWRDGLAVVASPAPPEADLRATLLAFVGHQAVSGSVWVAGGVIARDQAPAEAVKVGQRMALLADTSGESVVISALRGKGRARVLVAEDDRAVAHVLERLLAELELDVDVVGDGRQAVEAADAAPYALILLDIQMPEMSGLEALELIRAQPRHARTPIAMCTSLGAEAHLAAAFEAGADDYIVKPFGTRLFRARIHALLARR
ncbi:MAG: response regulator transcription factor [Alphaproteobacteria bacterium]|nr:response regulator transcription factor [Alphaproteobacteria bacterium]